MNAVLRLPATRVWVILTVAAVLSWALTEDVAAARIGTSAVMLIAIFKVRLIVIHFMELPWRPRPWRILFELWMLGIAAIILGGYWLTEI